MRSLEGSWSAPAVGLLVAVSLAGGCGGPAAAPYAARSDASLAGDAGPGWPMPVALEPVITDEPTALEPRHAGEVSPRLAGALPAIERPADVSNDLRVEPAGDEPQCVVATDCESGRCVRGICTTGRDGDPCEAREDCDTFCNPRTHRCGDFCVDPTVCR